MALENWLANRARSCPDRVALVDRERELTFAELELEAAAAARRLAGHGVGAGSAVAVELPAGIDYAVQLHALMKLGAIPCPLNQRLAAPERAHALRELQPGLVIDEDLAAAGEEQRVGLLPAAELDSIAARILTSGTSGRAHPVSLTYGNALWSAVGSAFHLGVDPTDRWLCCVPFHHVSGLSILFRSVIYGTCAVIHDGYSTDAVAAALESDRITIVSLVPTQLERLLRAGAELSRQRTILVGGAPVSPEALEEARGRGARIAQTYGLTEAASQVTTLSPSEARRRPGSSGRPLLNTEVRISQDEILVRGPTIAPGCAAEDGWLHTGDRGTIDDDGYLSVQGRLDEMIISGGENVMPIEIETVLAAHPGVAEVVVFGVASSEWGQAVEALVVPSADSRPSESDLREHCAASLAGFKVPKRVRFTDQLPRTANGKIRRHELG